MFHASPQLLVNFLDIFGVPWLVEASPRSLPSFLHGIVPVSQFPLFYKDTSHIVLGPTLMTSYRLIICQDPTSK